MVRRCSDQMAKTLMVVFNLLFLVCGIVVIALGAKEALGKTSITSIISSLSGLNAAVIVFGVAICLMSFLGCCGALRENSCMLTTFLVLLVGILIAEIAIGAYAFTHKNDVKDFIEKEAVKTLNNTKFWDAFQSDGHCCGVKGPQDYAGVEKFPASCCEQKAGNQEPCSATSPLVFHTGCLDKLVTVAKDNYVYAGVSAIVIAFIELAGIIFACCLREAVRDKYETV